MTILILLILLLIIIIIITAFIHPCPNLPQPVTNGASGQFNHQTDIRLVLYSSLHQLVTNLWILTNWRIIIKKKSRDVLLVHSEDRWWRPTSKQRLSPDSSRAFDTNWSISCFMHELRFHTSFSFHSPQNLACVYIIGVWTVDWSLQLWMILKKYMFRYIPFISTVL